MNDFAKALRRVLSDVEVGESAASGRGSDDGDSWWLQVAQALCSAGGGDEGIPAALCAEAASDTAVVHYGTVLNKSVALVLRRAVMRRHARVWLVRTRAAGSRSRVLGASRRL